jgi:ribosomal protein L37E
MSAPTYAIIEFGNAIQCLRCGKISHDPTYIKERYCVRCHQYHSEMMRELAELEELNDERIRERLSELASKAKKTFDERKEPYPPHLRSLIKILQRKEVTHANPR